MSLILVTRKWANYKKPKYPTSSGVDIEDTPPDVKVSYQS